MARPQSPDYDKRRDAIVAAAARLYAMRGFNGTSVAELAEACRSSKSLIYHYFPSKDDILHEVMAAHLDALVAAADAALCEETAERRLRALAHGFMRLYVGAEAHHKVLLNELDNLPPARRAEVVAKQRRIIAVVEGLIRELRPDAGELGLPLAMLFFGMINWTHTWFRADGPIGPDRLADLALDLMLHGIAAPAALEPA
jgi:AcrR family transcriptional regulator